METFFRNTTPRFSAALQRYPQCQEGNRGETLGGSRWDFGQGIVTSELVESPVFSSIRPRRMGQPKVLPNNAFQMDSPCGVSEKPLHQSIFGPCFGMESGWIGARFAGGVTCTRSGARLVGYVCPLVHHVGLVVHRRLQVGTYAIRVSGTLIAWARTGSLFLQRTGRANKSSHDTMPRAQRASALPVSCVACL